MSGLLFLSADDFTVNKGTKGNILCHSIPGFSLILFYSTQCEHCQKLIPIFKKLPGTIGGCQFGMVNVSANKAVIKMSKDTVTPITYVPYIVLYINSKPFMKYAGPHDTGEIRRFVFEVAQKVNTKQKFSDEQVKEDVRGGIPAYTIGHPLYGEDNCTYLEFEEAYTGDKQKKPPGPNVPSGPNGGSLYGQNDARSNQQSLIQKQLNRR
jgi:thiol-disulfide isomerase/thioredoxin